MRSFLHEACELGHSEVLLVERAVDLLHYLLEAISAHHVAVALHSLHGFARKLPRVPLGNVFLASVDQAGERVVAVVLVAVLNEQIARRFPNSDADNVLAVLLELDDKTREIAVTAEEYEGADLGSSEDQLERIDGEPDIGGVLL